VFSSGSQGFVSVTAGLIFGGGDARRPDE
jgi:hypothetical protein